MLAVRRKEAAVGRATLGPRQAYCKVRERDAGMEGIFEIRPVDLNLESVMGRRGSTR